MWFREFASGLQDSQEPYSIPGLNVQGIRGYLKTTPQDSTHIIFVNSYPSMAVDTSAGPYRGTIYLVWADKRNAGQPDIYLTKREPSTQTWSSPIRVDNDSTGKDQWFPWVNVDPNGLVHVVFYDSRIDTTGNLMTAVFMATSRDGGETFENYLVSSIAFSPCNIYDRGVGAGTGFAGDYIGLTSDRRHAYPCWNDNRTGIHQAYMACVPIPIHLDSNTHWTGAITLERQVIVDSGVTLYVDSGAVVSVATEYGPCPKIAITVAKGGVLEAYKASFVSAAQTPAAGDWQGIVVDSGGVADVKACTLRHAVAGLHVNGQVDSIAACVFERCSTGVFLDNPENEVSIVSRNVFDRNATGLRLLGGSNSAAKWNVFRGVAADEIGIQYTDGLTTTIVRNVFDSLGGAGILSLDHAGGSPSIKTGGSMQSRKLVLLK